MAKSGDKVKRGFFSYVFLFILILVGAFMVAVVVMLFNPGMNILGLKYFRGSSTSVITKSGSEDLEIGTRLYEAVEVNMDYGEFRVQNSNQYSQNSIVIINKAKGFATTKSNTEFSSSVRIEGSKLVVNVTSPQGFLYFSKNIEVILNLGNVDDAAFSSTKIKVNSKSADVVIGEGAGPYIKEFHVGSLDINTVSGNIDINETASDAFSSLNLVTESGKISINKNITVVGTESSVAPMVANIEIGKGRLFASRIEVGKVIVGMPISNIVKQPLELSLTTGRVNVKNFDVSSLNVKTTSGFLDIEVVSGSLDLERSSEIIDSSKIYIDHVEGAVNIPVGKDSDINIKTASNIYCNTTSGNINIGTTSLINATTTTGSIAVQMTNNSNIRTERGSLTIGVGSNGEQNITNNKGRTYIKFSGSNKIKFTFDYPNNTTGTPFDMTKVSFNLFNDSGIAVSNPYYYECDDSTYKNLLNIYTNGSVEMILV